MLNGGGGKSCGSSWGRSLWGSGLCHVVLSGMYSCINSRFHLTHALKRDSGQRSELLTRQSVQCTTWHTREEAHSFLSLLLSHTRPGRQAAPQHCVDERNKIPQQTRVCQHCGILKYVLHLYLCVCRCMDQGA